MPQLTAGTPPPSSASPDPTLTAHSFITRRAEDSSWSATHPGLKQAIDAAVARTASKPHYFWSGRIAPLAARTLESRAHADSVIYRAMDIAKARGGTTLELTMEKVDMPTYTGGDPDRKEIWQYASDEYASASRGDAYFVKGESLRSGNVWEVVPRKGIPASQEEPRRQAHLPDPGSPALVRIARADLA